MKSIVEIINKKETLYYLNGASISEIEKAEKALQLHFHRDYKEYLLNYGIISYENHELTGICKFQRLNVVDVTIEERKTNTLIPNDFYVIEQANIDGIVIWQSSDGAIYQSAPDSKLILIEKSLSDYILRN